MCISNKGIKEVIEVIGRCGGLMVSVLVSGLSGPCSSPGQGHCVVFLSKTLLLSQCLSSRRGMNGQW